MTEADKDALLVRAALDILSMEFTIDKLRQEIAAGQRFLEAIQRTAMRTGNVGLMSLQEAKVQHVIRVIEACGNKTRAAEILGISRSYVNKFLPKGYKPRRYRARKSDPRIKQAKPHKRDPDEASD